MMKESINRPYIIAPTRNLIRGTSLFFEGMYYEKRKMEAINVGTHLSAFLHDHGKVATIHFREGLEQLTDLQDTPINLTKKFLSELNNDHRELARKIITPDSPFYSVQKIWGLCGLSAKWGERHGYQTVTWSTSRQLIEAHEASIVNRPSGGNLALPNPLTLFLHNRDTFLKFFLDSQNIL